MDDQLALSSFAPNIEQEDRCGTEYKHRQQMRLGTRSCVECRRRRVRCEFTQSHQACEACLLHKAPCRTQHADRVEKFSVREDALSQRLDVLEAEITARHSNIQRHSSILSPLTGHNTTTPTNNGFATFRDEGLKQDTAPLMEFANAALGVHFIENKSKTQEEEGSHHVKDALYRLQRVLPDQQTLHSILAATKAYWSIWPPYYIGPSKSDQLKAGCLEQAMMEISEALKSADVQCISKALLWLALCIQQLSPQWVEASQSEYTAPMQSIVDVYMDTAQKLLATDETIIQSMSTIECHLFQYKLLINLGKGVQAWSINRQALNKSLLFGLHRLDSSSEGWKLEVWSQLWQADTLLSLVFGLPTVSIYSPGQILPSGASSNEPIEVVNRVFQIATCVIERNQRRDSEDYAVTIKLDQDWQQCWAILRADNGSTNLNADASLDTVYYCQVVKLTVNVVGKLIHLPYLLKARTDVRYKHSQMMVLQTSQEMMKAYICMREHGTTRNAMCELMDFQAFGAAFTVAVELLSRPPELIESNEEELWNLIAETGRTLKRTSVTMQCYIAAQGVQVLEALQDTHHKTGKTLSTFEADIPYFGKIAISITNDESSNVLTADGAINSPYDMTSDFFDFPFLGDFDPAAVDLNADWGIEVGFLEGAWQ